MTSIIFIKTAIALIIIGVIIGMLTLFFPAPLEKKVKPILFAGTCFLASCICFLISTL